MRRWKVRPTYHRWFHRFIGSERRKARQLADLLDHYLNDPKTEEAISKLARGSRLFGGGSF